MLTLNLEENGNFPACGPIVNDMHSNFGGEIEGWTQKDTLPELFMAAALHTFTTKPLTLQFWLWMSNC